MRRIGVALRTLFKTPFVTLIAIVSLALGIGANSATFSLMYQMLLRPLPVPEADRLVNLAAGRPNPGMQSCNNAGGCDEIFSYPVFRDLEATETAAFAGLAAHRTFGANLAFRGRTLDGEGVLVSGGYFPVLGLQPAAGRLISPDDDRSFGGHFVAVLGHAYWRTRFDASPEVIGETLVVNGQPLIIIGVAPQGFEGTTLGNQPEVFVPLTMHGLMIPQWKDQLVENRRGYWLYVFGRLRPEVSLEQARAAINVPYHAIINDVEVPLQEGMSEQTLARFKSKQIRVADGRRGQSSLHRDARAPVWLLFAVTGVVLLIACANIANLLLARTATRATEMAVRLSVGASRRHLIGQLLVESCLLAVFGGLAGLVVAHWTLTLIRTLLPPEAISIIQFELLPQVILFAAALSVGTGLFFGLFPAFHSTRKEIVSVLKGDSGQPSGSRTAARFRTTLATAQIALSMALLISAGLFGRSLLNVSRVDIGIEVDGLTTFSVSPELSNYSPDESRALFERIEDEVSAIPGVTDVSAALVPIIAGNSWGTDVAVDGFESGADIDDNSRFNEIGPDYFRTLRISLLAGRDFTRSDALGAPKVAIVNEAFAKKFDIEGDVVGRRMTTDTDKGELDIEIVGFMPDMKYSEVKQEAPPLFVTPYRQDEDIGFLTFYVRSALPSEQLFPAIRATLEKLDPRLPVEDVKTMRAQVRENVFVDRMISTLSAAFAVLATLLAAVGLYGVLAYSVTQRTREIGLRMALGADGGRVRRMVLSQVGWMTLIGGAVGIAAAIGLGRVARSLLFEVKGHDPVVLAVSATLLAAIALTAGLIPALHASRIDPMRALRYE